MINNSLSVSSKNDMTKNLRIKKNFVPSQILSKSSLSDQMYFSISPAKIRSSIINEMDNSPTVSKHVKVIIILVTA